jgi:hypothetical protein
VGPRAGLGRCEVEKNILSNGTKPKLQEVVCESSTVYTRGVSSIRKVVDRLVGCCLSASDSPGVCSLVRVLRVLATILLRDF